MSSSPSSKSDLLTPSIETSSTQTITSTQTLVPSPTPYRNNLAYILLSLSIYFQENYYSGNMPHLVPSSYVGLTISFIFLPSFLLKTLFIKLIQKTKINLRIIYVSVSFFFSFLISIFCISEDMNKNVLPMIFSCFFSSLGLGLGEITALENSSLYQRKCSLSWSIGHGVSGLLSSLLSLVSFQKLDSGEFKYSTRNRMLLTLTPVAILPIAQFLILGLPKIISTQVSLDKKDKKENKKEYSLGEILKLVFFGNFMTYTYTLFFDYFFYMLIWTGIVPAVKDRLNYSSQGNSKATIGLAFIGVKVVALITKFAPFVCKLEKVVFLPFLHLVCGAVLLARLRNEKSSAVVILCSVGIGAVHGLASAYGIVCIREFVEKRWVKFALKNITVANSLGAMMGCYAAIGLSVLCKGIVESGKNK